MLNIGIRWKTMLVLDLDKVHAGVAEKFQVPVHGSLSTMIGRVKV
jgi:hypothetical protein